MARPCFSFPALTHNHLTPPAEEPIIQPVLGWNDGQNAGPWNITSWNCCPAGMAWSSTPVTVNPGDHISGTVMTACGSVIIRSCAKWKITTTDVTTGGSTTLNITYPGMMNFVWAQSGVLEVYNIYQCSDYPPDGSITFSNVALYDNYFRRIAHPGWAPELFVTQGQTTPWCDYRVTLYGHDRDPYLLTSPRAVLEEGLSGRVLEYAGSEVSQYAARVPGSMNRSPANSLCS